MQKTVTHEQQAFGEAFEQQYKKIIRIISVKSLSKRGMNFFRPGQVDA